MDLTKLDWQDLLMWRQKSELLYEKNLQIKELLMETYIGFICLYLKGTIAGSISVLLPPHTEDSKRKYITINDTRNPSGFKAIFIVLNFAHSTGSPSFWELSAQ